MPTAKAAIATVCSVNPNLRSRYCLHATAVMRGKKAPTSIYGENESLLGKASLSMSLVQNRAVIEVAKGYIAKEEVGHNRDAFELLYRAVSDVNALWVVWKGVPVLLKKGPDWARAVGSASLMERLAERAARDCIAGLLNADISEVVGPKADDDNTSILDAQIDTNFRRHLEDGSSTLVLLKSAAQTMHAESLPATVIGQQAKLWSTTPSAGTKYQYDSVSVGSADISTYVKEVAKSDAAYLAPMRQIRLHMTEVGRKRRRLAYGEAIEPLIAASVRDAGFQWGRRVQMFREVHAKAVSAFCDREGAFLALPTIVRHMHAGTIDQYVDGLSGTMPAIPVECDLAAFIEYHPVGRVETIKDELKFVADRVEFGCDNSRWHVGHGATISADVWAAVCSLAINPSTKNLFGPMNPGAKAPASDGAVCPFIQIALVDDKNASHRPADVSYTIEAVTSSENDIVVTVYNSQTRHRLKSGEHLRIELPPDGSWTRIRVSPSTPIDGRPPATFRFRRPIPAPDLSVISPILVGVDSNDGLYRDGTQTYADALPAFRRRELPLSLLYPTSDERAGEIVADTANALKLNFEGFISVSDEDARRVAYAAKIRLEDEPLPGVDVQELSAAFRAVGPSALYTPKLAWVRSHDGVATLCTVHYNGRQRFVPTDLYEVAVDYVRESIRDAIDLRDKDLLNHVLLTFDRDHQKYDEGIAAAADLIVATSRSTLYHDNKAVDENQRKLRRVVGNLIAEEKEGGSA